jgi:hypothetical protein
MYVNPKFFLCAIGVYYLSLDIQNATNRQNIYGKYFDPLTGKTKTAYQTSLIPILSYKLEF